MPVLVSRKAPASPHLPSSRVRQMAERMLLALGVQTAELSVLLTDDAFIHGLNRKHRQKNRATDVLSFPLMDPDDEQFATLEDGPLGDVVISIDTAVCQADRAGIALLEEVRRLLAHGILHLMAYGHETDAEEKQMNRMAARLVEASREGV